MRGARTIPQTDGGGRTDVATAASDALLSVPLVAGIAAVLAILVRLPFLSWPVTVDEAGYAYGARWWFSGLTMYSDDLWFDRPQGIFLVYRLGTTVFGDSVEAIRLNGALWAAGTVAAVVLLSARIFDRRVAVVAGLLCAVVGTAPVIEGFTANAEVFMVTATTASACCVWGRRWLLAGLFAGIAILLKPSGAAACALAFFWLIHERESRRAYGLVVLGAAVPLLASLVHGIASVGFDDYWFAVVWFRVSSGGQNPALPALLAGWFATSPVWLILGVLAYPAREVLAANTRGRAFVAAWLVSSVLGMAMGGNWFLHYFEQLVPPLAVLAGVGVVGIATRPPVIRWWAPIGVLTVVVAAAILVLPTALMDPADGAAAVFSGDDYSRSDEVGAYVASITGPDDRVYVAISHVSVLFRSERRSSFPYLYAQQLQENPGAVDRAISDLEAAVPAVVVVHRAQLDSFRSGSSISEPVTRNYQLDRSFGAFEVWLRHVPDAALAGD